MPLSLCLACTHGQRVVSGTGSQFLLCRLALSDKHYPKYPPQPVVRCDGYSQTPPQNPVG